MFTMVEHLLFFSKVWRHLGIKVLSLWSLGVEFGPILAYIGLQLLKSSWAYFSFSDAPNVLCRWKIWTAGRPVQHLDSSQMKPCCCNSCSMRFFFLLSCWNTQGLPWNRHHLEGTSCCSKTLIYLSAFIVPSKHGSCPDSMYFCTSIPSEMLTLELKADNMLEGLRPL